MIFLLKTLTTDGAFRDFSYAPAKLEHGFQLLSTIVANGDVLIDVRIVEHGRETKLPPGVFDGTPFMAPIRELEQEWQTLLTEPESVDTAVDVAGLIDLNQQWMDVCETAVWKNEALIKQFKALLRRNEESLYPGPRQAKLAACYRLKIAACQKEVTRIQLCQWQLGNRLSRLAQLLTVAW